MQRNPKAKSQANILMKEMEAAGTPIKYQQALEMVAKMSGFRDWNAMAAAPEAVAAPVAPAAPAPTDALSPANVAELIDLAQSLINSCDDTGCDGCTVADADKAEELRQFLMGLKAPAATAGALPPEIARFNAAKHVAFIMSVGDVHALRPHLSDEEAIQVLQKCKYRLDLESGFSWDSIRDVADEFFPVPLLKGTVTFNDEDIKEQSRSATVNLLKKGQVLIDGEPLRNFNRDGEGWFTFDGLPDEEFQVLNGKLEGTEDDDDGEHAYRLRELSHQLKLAGLLSTPKKP